MPAYYNEINAYAAQWLRNLISAGMIAPGDVDERSIKDVRPDDLRGYEQCHFFAGIGGWSKALRLAGRHDSERIWTGSCPCQPFSQAGKGKGEADERHLWPEFRRLIAECSPPVVFGEQVAAQAGRVWLAGVRADLEAMGYAVGAADLCAAGVSAPHVRARLYWVADANHDGQQAGDKAAAPVGYGNSSDSASRIVVGLGDADCYHRDWWSGPLQVGWNCIEGEITRGGRQYRAQWRLKPGLSIVAHGIPGRVGQLCAYGNAIVPQLAAEMIRAHMEISNG